MLKFISSRKLRKILIIFAIIIIVIVLSAVSVGFCFYVIKMPVYATANCDYKDTDLLDNNIKTDWQANWIWTKRNRNNSYVDFIKTFTIDIINTDYIADIAVESKYKLWLNDRLVIVDGGLKRGPTYKDTYYEQINLTEYLIIGVNTLAIEVNYFGEDGYDNNDSGQGGLLFQMPIGNSYLISDSSWKVRENKNYKRNFLDAILSPNYRLSESSVIYNAKGEEDWQLINYDSSDWKNAEEFGLAPCAPWNNLHIRKTPPLKDYGLTDYINSSEYIGLTTTKSTTITLKLPYNCQFSPYIEVESKSGKKIKVTTYKQQQINSESIKFTYITKDGLNKYEMYGYLNGDFAEVIIPRGVKILALKYRETSYGSEETGAFDSGSESLNKLWEKSFRSLMVNMRDTYTDCPDRERTAWLADAANSMEMAFYALDTNSYSLGYQTYETLLGWVQADSVITTVAPNGVEAFELPMQNLAGIVGIYRYYMYTGDESILSLTYDMCINYLKLYSLDNYLIIHREGSWDWADWGDNADIAVMENSWYYYALNSVRYSALVLGITSDAEFLNIRSRDMFAAFNKKYWTENGYASGEVIDDRANALAVLAGLATSLKYNVIKDVLTSTFNSSPYMEKFAIEALCYMDFVDEGIDRMLTRYDDMINSTDSTLWELWDRSASINHAWGGGGLIIMGKYLLGISPIVAGYSEYLFKPELGNLNYINGTVPTVKGNIDISITENEIILNAEFNSIIDLEIPKHNNITVNGVTVISNGVYNVNGLIFDFREYSDKYIFSFLPCSSIDVIID